MIPAEIAARMASFLEQGQTGKIELDVKDGKITGGRIIESLRLDRPQRLTPQLSR